MKRFLHAGLCAIIALNCLACPTPAGSRQRAPDVLLDLTDRFSPVPPVDRHTDGNAGFFPKLPVTRKGKREDALVLVAPIRVRATFSGVTGQVFFEALAAPVFNLGDGIQLEVSVSNDREEKLLFERHFDGAAQASDRDWIGLEIPIDLGAGGTWHLEMRAAAGRRGDLTGDWLAVARPRLRRRG